MAYQRTFGEIPGHPEGSTYATRAEMRKHGLHAHNQAGISGTKKQGADAIVLSGGYPDDQDYGDIIVYTGHGGQDANKKQIADQTLDDNGNAGLVKSQLDKLPVRVIRGSEEDSEFAPASGYQYGGLYRVVRHWFKTRADGFKVCQFLMVKWGSVADVEDPQLPAGIELPVQAGDEGDTAEVGPVGRTKHVINKVQRRADVVRNVKSWYKNQCQICRKSVALPSGPSSEAAHIRPLGVPHNGPDHESNVLCLCPNDHLRFDNGALYITSDFKIVDNLTGEVIGDLWVQSEHKIGVEYINYHHESWTKE
ncbi:YDG/SRA domain-containing protein [Streptomonospora nanhaiensis]|uniref:YDG/SRA domain-containing protein n=1 Tax=Streptomonospora nanhaiensis TaxID=1323731 RepID=UPI001C3955A1|nr:YDG/SRA domain-containing protein [Streptomonospora nanhaiensis]MBV2364611.1 HNH endonuclease [Streptomonospora nanhaiensis]